MENLDRLNENILISLHPKMEKLKYKFLEEKYNSIIVEERLVNILPIADIFISTFSSTVLWSVLCGIKTIVIDFYNLEYKMYDFLTSIAKVNEKEKLYKVLELKLEEEVDFAQDWKELSREEVFDGLTIQRYAYLLKKLGRNK